MDDAAFRDGLSRPEADPRTVIERMGARPLSCLRLYRPSEADVAEASAAIGIELARAPNRVNGGGPRSLRLAPGEWLLLDVPNATELSRQLGKRLHHMSDLTAGRTTWAVRGGGASDLLQAGCSLDLDFDVFPPGGGVRTLLAQVSVVILRPSDASRFEVIADYSHTAYLQSWFREVIQGRE